MKKETSPQRTKRKAGSKALGREASKIYNTTSEQEVNSQNPEGPKSLPEPERLYMTAATAKRKAGVVENTIDPNGRARSLLPASEYKIADISANVNPADATEIKADGSRRLPLLSAQARGKPHSSLKPQ